MLKGWTTAWYKIFGYTYYKEKKKTTIQIPFRKLVAEYFLPKPKTGQVYVINIDYNRKNDFVTNLKWVTKKEYLEHSEKSPKVIAFRERKKELSKKSNGKKLTISRVEIIKKKLFDPNRKTRISILARQFGISASHLYRIRKGQKWGHITID